MDTKRVKFEIDSNEFNTEINEEEFEGNDLDLDTIKSSRNKQNELKEFDSEGSDEDLEHEFQVDSTDSGEEEYENDVLDDREVPIVPFNLKADREEGSFDSEGFYVKKHDEEADQDRWMAHFTHSDIQKARKAHVESEQRKLEKQKEQLARMGGKSEKQLWEELAEEMDGYDHQLSVLGIMTNLKTTETTNNVPRAPLNKNRLKKLQKEQQAQGSPQPNKLTPENLKKLEKLTELADALMDLGHFSVYEETRREILRKLNK